MVSTHVGYRCFVEQPYLHRPLYLGIRPNTAPAYFDDFSCDGVRVLYEAFEYRQERIPMLLEECCFGLSGAVRVDEGKKEKDIQCSDI